MELKKDGIYDSYEYIKYNNIKIDSVIINEYELSQINNGIKKQKRANIKKINLLYRSTRDGGLAENYHSKCDGYKNLLTLVKTSDGKKFGGFSSLQLNSFNGREKDDTAFIFSLDKKQNYYIKKGYNAIYFINERGPIFGETFASGSEFNINVDGKNCFEENSCYDDTGSSCCYDYGKEKHLLAGQKEFRVSDYEVFNLEFIEL